MSEENNDKCSFCPKDSIVGLLMFSDGNIIEKGFCNDNYDSLGAKLNNKKDVDLIKETGKMGKKVEKGNEELISKLKKEMKEASDKEEFLKAVKIRDKIKTLEKEINNEVGWKNKFDKYRRFKRYIR